MSFLALGPGKAVASVNLAFAPAIVTIECERLPALGKEPAGGPDADGLDLHVRYEGVRPLLQDKSDDARAILVCEFDPQRLVIVPYCGTIALTGGSGRYRWSISQPEKWPGVYVPEWRSLTRLLVRGKSFTVPDGHTRIGSLNAEATVTSADGDLWALDGTPKPIGSGTRATATSRSVRLFTLAHL